MSSVDVLIPTFERPTELAVTLAGVASQSRRPARVIVAEQSASSCRDSPPIATLRRLLEVHGSEVVWRHRKPVHGIAEQRDFLVNLASADRVLMIDDDVFMEPWVLGALMNVLDDEPIGFVGAFPAGLSFLHDVRPHQQRIEFWHGRVTPEAVEPDSPEWSRAAVHAAANSFHVGQQLSPGQVRRYKISWVGACALYDRRKLQEVGGFSFWRELPEHHAGEEVLVQNLLMRRWGGCAILPSGTYHQESPTTIDEAGRTPQANAISLLHTKIAEFPGQGPPSR